MTIVCALKACCGSTGTIAKGREVHDQAIKVGVELELIIGNTLIGMYVKSCSLREVEQVFDISLYACCLGCCLVDRIDFGKMRMSSIPMIKCMNVV